MKIYVLGCLLFLAISICYPAIAGQSDAKLDAGTFYCGDCIMTDSVMDPDTRDFIEITVNGYLDGSWLNSDLEPMHVEICNNSICVTWQYTGGGQFLKAGTLPQTGGHTYKNGPSTGSTGSGNSNGGGAGSGNIGNGNNGQGYHYYQWCADEFVNGEYVGTGCVVESV